MSEIILSSIQDGNMQEQQDEVLQELQSVLDPIINKIDNDYQVDRALMTIGAKEITDSDGEYIGVESYLDSTGDQGLLQEALYDGLMSLIKSGQPELFESLREVIKEIEEDMGLEEGVTLLTPPTLH